MVRSSGTHRLIVWWMKISRRVRVARERICLEETFHGRVVVIVANNKAEGSAPLTVFRLAGRDRSCARRVSRVTTLTWICAANWKRLLPAERVFDA